MANPFDDHGPAKSYGSVAGPTGGFQPASDRDTDFVHMRRRIADACLEISSQTSELKSLSKKIGTRNDDVDLRVRIHEVRKSAFDIVESTTELFNVLIAKYGNTSDRGQAIAIESLRKNFGKAANDFSQVYETVVNRLQENPRPHVTDSFVSTNHDDDSAALLETAQQVQRQNQLHVSYAQERAEIMEGLENDMVQLHEIMTSIQGMVVEQGENIGHIETHVERAAEEVEKGRSQLGTAVRYKRINRKLTLAIIVIVSVILLAIVIVLLIFICGVGKVCHK